MIKDLFIFPGGTFALTCSKDKTIILWNLNNKCIEHKYVGHTSAVTTAAVNNRQNIVVSAAADGSIRIWDLHTTKCLYEVQGAHKRRIELLRFSYYGDHENEDQRVDEIITSSRDNCLTLWKIKCKDVREAKEAQQFTSITDNSPHMGMLTRVHDYVDEKMNVTRDNNNNSLKLKSHPTHFAISPDGSLVSFGIKHKGAYVQEQNNERKFLLSLQTIAEARHLVYNYTRYWLCVVSKRCIQVFDLESKQPVADKISAPMMESSNIAGKVKRVRFKSAAWGSQSEFSHRLHVACSDGKVRTYSFDQQ